MSTLLSWLKDTGKLRQGRRTPETVYASFDDNLDDRTTNFPVTLIQDIDLAEFVVEAVNEKLVRGRQENIDPEAWLADQLAQVGTNSTDLGDPILYWAPGERSFQAVLKLAQEYGEMCAARATEGIKDPRPRSELIGNLTGDLMSLPGWLKGPGEAEAVARRLVNLGWCR